MQNQLAFEDDIYQTYKRAYIKNASPENLKLVREYLDMCGMYMKTPAYHYKEDDINTWKYLDGKIYKNKHGEVIKYTTIYNPNFKYGHLV